MSDIFDMFGPTPASETERLRQLNNQGVGSSRPAARKPDPKPLPQIRGKEFEGVLYLNAADILTALESSNQGGSPLAAKLRSAVSGRSR